VPADIDLAPIVTDELEQLRAAHPNRQIEMVATGDDHCCCDGARVQQLVRNLVTNAIQYGSADTPVRVALRDEGSGVHLEVTNSGSHIDSLTLSRLFDPLKRGLSPGDRDESGGSLGLGLYIVREIARAHGSEVEVRSTMGETAFAVRLPRHKPVASH
jgi:signal transduction histidine kinase